MKNIRFSRVFLLFTIIPFIELFILLQLAEVTSAMTTLGIILVTGAVGAYLARNEGMGVINNIRNAFSMGQVPTDQMIHGLCVLIGGAFLLTPGILTDIVGFSLVIPATRLQYVSFIKSWAKKNINVQPVYTRDYDQY